MKFQISSSKRFCNVFNITEYLEIHYLPDTDDLFIDSEIELLLFSVFMCIKHCSAIYLHRNNDKYSKYSKISKKQTTSLWNFNKDLQILRNPEEICNQQKLDLANKVV